MGKPLSEIILEEVKLARPLVLFKVFRHDKDIKRYLGVKKLRKSLFYDISDSSFLIRGKGDLIVTDEVSAKLLLERIKKKLRYAEEIPA